MATSVTPDEIADALGRTAPDSSSPEFRQWQLWIDQAYQLIVWRYGVDAVAAMDPELVDYVVLEAVVQHIRAWSPTNARRTDVSVDDGRVATDYFTPAGTLAIPDSLWARLNPSMGTGAFSVRLEGEPDVGRCWDSTTEWHWCP